MTRDEGDAVTTPDAEAPGARGGLAGGLIKSLRPHQWVKNAFVLAPLFFSKSYTDPEKLAQGLGAALLFSLTSGSVYLINDIFDVEKDRNHPVKRHRPIASGRVSVRAAAIAAAVLGPGCLAIAWALDWRMGAAMTAYLIMNLAYSTSLKNVAFLDVTIIATGFVLRVLSGAFGIDVFISEWLVLCTFSVALYLGLGKRVHELKMVAQGRADKVRKVLERYRAEQLDFAMLFVSGLTIALYTTYTLTTSLKGLTGWALPNQPLRAHDTPFSSPWLPITIPLVIFGITRFYQLVHHDSPHSPTEQILRDRPFIANILLWGVTMTVIAFA